MSGAERRSRGRGPTQPPGGMAPPASARLPDGTDADLHALAIKVTEIHLERHPEDTERYGDLAWEWCVHDTQHLMAWAIEDTDLAGQLAWLGGVLDARGYPVANLYDCVLTCARVLREEHGHLAQAASTRMEDAARQQPSA